ncbi:MAG: hypothetical protein IPJ84_16525 [Bdellovibrionales bacterium]|nr:hypothetical protein [Bdellovibrionales bacterium]
MATPVDRVRDPEKQGQSGNGHHHHRAIFVSNASRALVSALGPTAACANRKANSI